MEMPRSSRTIMLTSLDPPGTKRPIPPPLAFAPKLDRHGIRDKLRKAEPFDTLPRGLIPSRRYAWGPPRLLYGWPAPEQLLLSYARKHKIVQRFRRRIVMPGTLNTSVDEIIRTEGVADISCDLLRVSATHMGMKDDNLVYIVAVYSNYDLKRKDLPSEETISTIRERLGINEPPKWYLDVAQWYWQRW
ncbi:hypothetical protein DAEQUDRAFT_815562 [Daedalea quercina L-15889]|uniref:Uncharacterized protein n=1 Tax=Daedalea quercina L-15889 TaxID=1314783 RepID=A0A165KUB0_9APHY|nr:hypothetical protein DAEQUDRAFT_815562 [Daedalea quercina L-15889]